VECTTIALDPFYQKSQDAAGIPIVASRRVNDEALIRAKRIVVRMLAHRPALHQALVADRMRIAIIGKSERMSDLPEYRGACGDNDMRGRPASKTRKLISASEENILRRPRWEDRHQGESLLVRAIAISLLPAIDRLNATFMRRLRDAHAKALEQHLFERTTATTSPEEYWAEGADAWFDPALEDPRALASARCELTIYDPRLSGLLRAVFGP
jgi:hypothetical protein